MQSVPNLKEFRFELIEDGIGHLIFDMPGRGMNVFSNTAIHEAEAFADWLVTSGLRGVVISSGKTTAFCAGADLGELSEAYAMIIAAPEDERTAVGRDHFAPIGRAFRKLETAGVPVAFAINGLALGGGCEFVMAGHYRVLADTPATALGLPESLVGLFPGGGGTQRMPRLVGLEASLPVLLDGARFSAEEALAAGLADRVVPAGAEIAAAVEWIKSGPRPLQPWDRPDWKIPTTDEIRQRLAPVRSAREAETKGHYPAITAIFDCLQRGLPLAMDVAVATEIDIFAHLIKRPEPRDMIRTQFLGKQVLAKKRKAGTVPEEIASMLADVSSALSRAADSAGREKAEQARIFAGFDKPLPQKSDESRASQSLPEQPAISATGLWIEKPVQDWQKEAVRLLAASVLAAAPYKALLNDDDQKLADFVVVAELGFPAYLGGPFALLESVGSAGIMKMQNA